MENQSVFIVCNCSPYKTSISIDNLENILHKEFGEVNLGAKQIKFKMVKKTFEKDYKTDYSIKKKKINELIEQLNQLSTEHIEKYQ